MKRPRPSIPVKVRCQVLERLAEARGIDWATLYENAGGISATGNFKRRVDVLIWLMFPNGCQLDHDPALILRPFNPKTGKYTPDANDPDFLVYREPREHLQKTIGRKADAEKTVTTKGSDIWLKSKFKRLEGPKKPKAKIAQRRNPWPKRKLQARKSR